MRRTERKEKHNNLARLKKTVTKQNREQVKQRKENENKIKREIKTLNNLSYIC